MTNIENMLFMMHVQLNDYIIEYSREYAQVMENPAGAILGDWA